MTFKIWRNPVKKIKAFERRAIDFEINENPAVRNVTVKMNESFSTDICAELG